MAELCPSHLLHLAWYVEPGQWVHSRQNFEWVRASLNLLSAFVDNGGKRATLAGSCAEYDWRYAYCKEDVTPLIPNTVYGTCKHALQQMFAEMSNRLGLSGVWGRIFFLYGPHEHPARLVSSVIRSLLQERSADCSHGEQMRDFLYVKDVANAFVALLENPVEGAVNIASGKPLALKKIILKIAHKLNRPDLVRLGALQTRANEPDLLVGDTTRLFKEIGWQPNYSLDQGLEETIAWWRNHMKGRL